MPLPYTFDEPLVTERLTLRMMLSDDVDAVHEWMSDPNGDYLQPAIIVDGEVAGAMYFTLTNTDDLTAEIGWALRRSFQGRGYAFEAASAILSLAFGELGLHRVYAELDPPERGIRRALSTARDAARGALRGAHDVQGGVGRHRHLRAAGARVERVSAALVRPASLQPSGDTPHHRVVGYRDERGEVLERLPDTGKTHETAHRH